MKSLWKIDQGNSHLEFRVGHLMISTLKGSFKDFTAHLDIREGERTAFDLDLEIFADSIQSGKESRNRHLRSADFLYASRYPKICFQSQRKAGSFLIGELEIRGQKRELELEISQMGSCEDAYGRMRFGIDLKGQFDRKDFGLNWNALSPSGNLMVSPEVNLDISLQFIAQHHPQKMIAK